MNLEAKAHTKTRTVLNKVTKPSYKDTIIPEQNTKKEQGTGERNVGKNQVNLKMHKDNRDYPFIMNVSMY